MARPPLCSQGLHQWPGRAMAWLFLLSMAWVWPDGWVARSEQTSDLPRASDVVKPRAYVPAKPVPRACKFEVAVVAEILPGFHINANKVLQDYLIPTTLEPNLPESVRLIETRYPPGQLKRFSFSEEKLNVYEGTVVLRARLQIAPKAPLGAIRIPLKLRYQACNDEACLPPVTLSLDTETHTTRAAAKTCFRRAATP